MSSPWRRLGRLALDCSRAPWAASHAALPAVEPLDDDRFWLYLSPRDAGGRARIGRAVLSMAGTPTLEPLEPEPALDLGVLGAFDDSGTTMSCIAASGGDRFLYYTGWSRGVTVPFYLAAGLATSRGDSFHRLSAAPLLDRNAVDPFLTASPFVMPDGERWRMWYVSATGWRERAGGAQHYYHIRYAESPDGLDWRRTGSVCIDYASPEEHAFARPWVLRDGDIYRMWYAVRGDRYRIGYAESGDGIRWTRLDDERGLTPSGSGWDSDMVEYPAVFDWRGGRYMLYNGNGYGQSGVGLAVQDSA